MDRVNGSTTKTENEIIVLTLKSNYITWQMMSLLVSSIVPRSGFHVLWHGQGTPGEEIAFTARPMIKSQSQIFR